MAGPENEPEVWPAPVLNLSPRRTAEVPLPVDEKWLRERAAFERLLPELLGTFRDRFVAVHDGQVVADGDDFMTTARAAYAKCGYIPIYVGWVSEQPRPPVRIAGFRVLSKVINVFEPVGQPSPDSVSGPSRGSSGKME